jgi:2'-5' RNA ligase
MDRPFQLHGLHIYEYLLVIDIPGELRKRIEQCRSELTEKYQIIQPNTGRVNVSLVRFSAMKMVEERIIQRLQMIAMDEKQFLVDLQDYGSYPMHAIFIRIANQPRVLQLIKKIKKARSLMKAAGEDPHFLQDPNIVLAGRIENKKYVEAMKEYQHNKFNGRFLADSFILLKRAKEEKKYSVVRKFEFQCTAVLNGQKSLFN